jgi:hypothetical protein
MRHLNNKEYVGEDVIIIPKSEVGYWRKKSGFLKEIMSNNMNDSNEYYDNEGNYYLKREVLSLLDDDEWEALEKLIKYRKINANTSGKFLTKFLLLKSSPLIKELNINNINENNIKESTLTKLKELKNEENYIVSNIKNTSNVSPYNIIKMTKQAKGEYTKYSKSGKRPSKTSKKKHERKNINKLRTTYKKLNKYIKEKRLFNNHNNAA